MIILNKENFKVKDYFPPRISYHFFNPGFRFLDTSATPTYTKPCSMNFSRSDFYRLEGKNV